MRTFGRQNSRDILNALKERADAFEKDPLNLELANHCAIDAWSLCEWVFKEHGERLGMRNLYDLQSSMIAMCSNLALLRDLANATKHKTIDKYIPLLKMAKKRLGGFQRNAFQSSGFSVSALVLIAEDDSDQWFDDVLKDAIRHWDDYFLINEL